MAANLIKIGSATGAASEATPLEPANGARFVVPLRRTPRNLFHLVCLGRSPETSSAGAIPG